MLIISFMDSLESYRSILSSKLYCIPLQNPLYRIPQYTWNKEPPVKSYLDKPQICFNGKNQWKLINFTCLNQLKCMASPCRFLIDGRSCIHLSRFLKNHHYQTIQNKPKKGNLGPHHLSLCSQFLRKSMRQDLTVCN